MQSILEKFVRHIDNFSIRKKMIFIYIFCMLLPITLTDGVIIYTVLHTEAQLRRSEMEDIAVAACAYSESDEIFESRDDHISEGIGDDPNGDGSDDHNDLNGDVECMSDNMEL